MDRDDSDMMLVTAVIEQAVMDARMAFAAGVINENFSLVCPKKQLPDRMQPRDIHSLQSFFNRDMDSFVEGSGLKVEPEAIRHGTKRNIRKPFKRVCHEAAIQDYERRWKVNPIANRANKPARRKSRRP